MLLPEIHDVSRSEITAQRWGLFICVCELNTQEEKKTYKSLVTILHITYKRIQLQNKEEFTARNSLVWELWTKSKEV